MKDGIMGFGRYTVEKFRLKPGEKEEDLVKRIESGEEKPYETKSAENLWLNSGWDELLKLIVGASSNTFNYTRALLGVGDDNTAADASQTDLLAATNKTYKGMESNFPNTPSGQTVTFRAKFTTSDANYEWLELVLKNSGSSVCWNRVVDAWGTKTSSEVWYMTLTIGKA